MIRENYPLDSLNSFKVQAVSKYFFEGVVIEELISFFKQVDPAANNIFILGEGSNILFTHDYDGYIVKPVLKGIRIVSQTNDHVIVNVSAGENWDEFVQFCVYNGFGGLENLSLIPGSVGACPVQNIGAYGVEVKDRIISVEGIYLPDLQQLSLPNADCVFGYRTSVFKSGLKDKFLITGVTFRLDKKPVPELRYDLVRQKFTAKKEQDLPSLRETIIEIRQSKLPDPSILGNAGSFFKNPAIDYIRLNDLIHKYPSIPSYPYETGRAKIPAAWLIEEAGWKGMREGNVGTYPSQPLVIVNYGNATGKEILDFSKKIQDSVKQKFGIELEREVNVL